MKVKGSFSSLIAHVFQNRGDPCNCMVREEETKPHLLGLMCKCGRLWSFVDVCGHLLVVCSRLQVVCGGLLVVCWWLAGGLQSFAGGLCLFVGGLCLFVPVCDRLCSYLVVACFSNYILKRKVGIQFS